MPLLTLLPIFGYAFTFHFKFKKTLSVSLFFSITFILSSLFVFGSLNLLLPGAHLLFWSGLALLLFQIKQNLKLLKETVHTPPFVLYTSLSFLAYFIFKDMNLFFWDEYSHWGPFIKNMYHTNRFQISSDHWAHLNYPPGAAVWNYFTMLFSSYKDGYLYFSYFLLLFSACLMMYEKINLNQWYWFLSILPYKWFALLFLGIGLRVFMLITFWVLFLQESF